MQRIYLIVTATVFTLIVAAHVAKAIAEGASVATDPVFLLLTAAVLGLAIWGWMLVFRTKGTPGS